MSAERWKEIERLYHAAHEVPSEQRTAFLGKACADSDVRREVETLLRQDAKSPSFMKGPAYFYEATMIGRKMAQYEIVSHLGSGGMGDVYKALDTRLGRAVALKVIPPAFSRDAERASRFEREARALAALNHSNIAALFGFEETSDGERFLAMELVEGPTLADRLAGGRIPVAEALDIGKQIAEALSAAHEKGIIHRDLKPANVKVTPDGKVKVLDFGLAKMFESEKTSLHGADPSGAPTASSIAATQAGVILGTAGYMSPEQIKGQALDRRSDVFALGCVLFEMLAGKPPFEGDSVTETLAQVLTRDPDWGRLPAKLSPRVREVLELCLDKDLRKRRRDAADVIIDIDRALSTEDAVAPRPARTPRLAWIVAGIGTLAFLVAVGLRLTEKEPPEPRVARFEIVTPLTVAPLQFALSPNGRYLAFIASDRGVRRLWVRSLDKTEAQPIAGTDGANLPFWSADSRSIGFFAERKLYRIDLSGGPPLRLADCYTAAGGAWNADGVILFSPRADGPLMRITASGGESAPVTQLDSRQSGHRHPHFLPDGRHFFFYAGGTDDVAGLYISSLDEERPRRLSLADLSGEFLPPDRVVFRRGSVLLAQRLDIKRASLMGDPVTIADTVGSSQNHVGGFAVSAQGDVAYRGGAGSRRQLAWYDRSGRPLGTVGEPDSNALLYPELSPDERSVAVQRTVKGNIDVWLMDLIRGGSVRLTTAEKYDSVPLWSPDGSQIEFESNRAGLSDLYKRPSNPGGAEEVILETPIEKFGQDWSKDEQFLLYGESVPNTGRDLWAISMSGNKTPILVANKLFDERNGQFSPDVHWVAYQTNASGRSEIVVQPFPKPARQWQVSINGGIQPRWSADGKELYFISLDEKMMAVSIVVRGTELTAGIPVALFPVRVVPGQVSDKQQYDVSRDGRFLINQPLEEPNTPITLILSWKPGN